MLGTLAHGLQTPDHRRSWIMLVPNHRLCPQVDMLDGPMRDCHDLLRWVYDGYLDGFLARPVAGTGYSTDMDKVMASGTSSSGTLALALALALELPWKAGGGGNLGLRRPAVHFTHASWRSPLPCIRVKLPQPAIEPCSLAQVYAEQPVATSSGVLLEGQAGAGRVCVYANWGGEGGGGLRAVDPVMNVDSKFPPTWIVHGVEDRMVPIEMSRVLLGRLREGGVECGMTDVEGEDHTFAATMEVGSRTWEAQKEGFDFLERMIAREM
ncbi:uncharacterized protein ACLA_065610 [Aspergillus clavatus NRRL 1]|uniref:Alpha/beta-hydrolase n=1 Tax=Aspergillus clavatus (strain ATCC 1007 / CBS 513.65 / DSM 816 / NCTC 3887 / NRRL 1 / QM 1276 / 107) TaxID=344612 RepID=A1CG47_ASPCL|nr:uncharacterized protein ACLA_065610 [Aspergillus clavatus NRRL 1]EAW10927.1 conserved hypothetical protein [Aspergillus clavatus NRRL 1]